MLSIEINIFQSKINRTGLEQNSDEQELMKIERCSNSTSPASDGSHSPYSPSSLKIGYTIPYNIPIGDTINARKGYTITYNIDVGNTALVTTP